MNHGSLFSGIGGFDLASEWMGWNNIFHCEINEFGQKVLKYYWPNAISYTDIKNTDFSVHRGKIDILTGGFPCQPFSAAGKRKGNEDDRHLWPEMLRAIKQVRPRWIVGENVLGLLNWSDGLVFHEVQTDLEAAGYVIFPYVLPACAKDAPHRRDRVWIVAHRDAADTSDKGLQGRKINGSVREIGEGRNEQFAGLLPSAWEEFPTQPPLYWGDDGLSARLAGITVSEHRVESIKAYGNAVVPQVVYEIFQAIEQYEL